MNEDKSPIQPSEESLAEMDAKAAAMSFYARYGFQPMDAVEGLSDARPRPTPMFLPSEITAASPRSRAPKAPE